MVITVDLLAVSSMIMVAISTILFFSLPFLAVMALRADNRVIDMLLDWVAYRGAWWYLLISVLCLSVTAFAVFGNGTVTLETIDSIFKHMILNSLWIGLYTIAVRLHDYRYRSDSKIDSKTAL